MCKALQTIQTAVTLSTAFKGDSCVGEGLGKRGALGEGKHCQGRVGAQSGFGASGRDPQPQIPLSMKAVCSAVSRVARVPPVVKLSKARTNAVNSTTGVEEAQGTVSRPLRWAIRRAGATGARSMATRQAEQSE